ncbi:pyridoxamine 5'-phosphate oxidase family protein [Saccharothrix hoggarensis]|uniref:Pyridoxamine 5'-phosphate oxidase family protein n=1 Tax=Saccharothrix hoggarensis TaxID=913853 RepID=A0ABW3QZ16_9PSEU
MTTAAATEVEELVRATLAAHPSMYLATAGSSGPWVNGVFFAETDLFTLNLVLEQRGRTLTAIRENPVVAVVVSTGSPQDPFLQAQADVEVVSGAEDEEVRRVLVEKVPAAAAFLGAPIVAARLGVRSWRATDVPRGWLPGRQLPNPALQP